jgi:hypothetical protein
MGSTIVSTHQIVRTVEVRREQRPKTLCQLSIRRSFVLAAQGMIRSSDEDVVRSKVRP